MNVASQHKQNTNLENIPSVSNLTVYYLWKTLYKNKVLCESSSVNKVFVGITMTRENIYFDKITVKVYSDLVL